MQEKETAMRLLLTKQLLVLKKKLELGADLVQLYTGMIYRGPVVIQEILGD